MCTHTHIHTQQLIADKSKRQTNAAKIYTYIYTNVYVGMYMCIYDALKTLL